MSALHSAAGEAAAQAPDLLSVEEALAAVLAAVPDPLPAEDVAPEAALGRWLAAPVVATTDLPPWDNSAMDGYAIRAADTAAATEDRPAVLRVTGEVRAGEVAAGRVERGTAFRIATGAPLPAGADAVVPVEQTTPLDASGLAAGPRGRDATGPLPPSCAVHVVVGVGGSVRRRGDDLRAGTVVLAAGARLGPGAVALAAGAGAGAVAVHRRPRVAVLATGDEVREPGTPLGPAGIPDANGPGLRALVASAGATPVSLGVARDDLGDVVGRLAGAIGDVDAVIVSGGVSVGPYDVVRAAFQRLGRVDLWRVAVQPGKPFAFGVAERPDGRPVPLFGLPGNPVSSAVTFELFVRPALHRLAGERATRRDADRGVLLDRASTSPGRRAFLRVVVERDADGAVARDASGRVRVRLAGGQGSHVLTALGAAEALAIVPEQVEVAEAGSEVALWWLDRG
jgi:molybdopterin molybdotransferase